MSPVIIDRSKHTVSRKNISPEALKVLYRLKEAGYIAYLAGGSVRDLLLGRTPKDFDIATNAHPHQVKNLFRNCRLIGRRFRLAHVYFHNSIIEVSTFRARLMVETGEHAHHFKQRDGLILRDNVFGTPEEDAWRRDFTVNALFYNIADFSVIDYVDGLKDLDARLLRVIGDPVVRFNEDPVRMIRAIRFACSCDLTIEESARKAILELRDRVALASRERLYDEFLKLAFCGHAEKVAKAMLEYDLFGVLFPEMDTWMKESKDHGRRIWFFRALRQVDIWKKAGLKPDEPLLWALIFGEYHEDKAQELIQQGCRPAEALVRTALDHMLNPDGRVQIPKKIAHETMRIMAMQPHFERTTGAKPKRLAARPSFGHAFVYFKFAANTKSRHKDLVEWWTSNLASG
jgi:poly(A) polymerase